VNILRKKARESEKKKTGIPFALQLFYCFPVNNKKIIIKASLKTSNRVEKTERKPATYKRKQHPRLKCPSCGNIR